MNDIIGTIQGYIYALEQQPLINRAGYNQFYHSVVELVENEEEDTELVLSLKNYIYQCDELVRYDVKMAMRNFYDLVYDLVDGGSL